MAALFCRKNCSPPGTGSEIDQKRDLSRWLKTVSSSTAVHQCRSLKTTKWATLVLAFAVGTTSETICNYAFFISFASNYRDHDGDLLL